ncbi:MAG: hypothetical protein ACO1G9_04045 [Bacteroidota bacterium]
MKKEPKDLVIPLSKAIEMVANWQSSEAFQMTGGFKAFRIPAEEINQFKEKYNDEGVGVRAYIGLEAVGEANELVHNLRLIFVATKKEETFPPYYSDIISIIDGEKVAFDLSSPCPTDCDMSSPLFNPNILDI